MEVPIGNLVGKVLTAIENSQDSLTFRCADGDVFRMYHEQDCCESVELEDIAGDLENLIGVPILKASEESNSENPKSGEDSHTWTFYHLATINGYVTLRWYGESNGFYSESVSFARVE